MALKPHWEWYRMLLSAASAESSCEEDVEVSMHSDHQGAEIAPRRRLTFCDSLTSAAAVTRTLLAS